MSYKHLPVWLRPCFLYLGLFPEDSKIDVASLIKLWVAEGFIKPTKSQSMEQVAESYIRDLVGRNLLLVESKREIVTIHDLVGELCGVFEYKTVTIHDIVRELCIKTAEKENFYCVQRDLNGGCEFIRDEKSAYFYPQESVSFSENPIVMRIGQRQASCECRLSRVLIDKDWLDTCEQVNLRYLYQDFGTSPIPSSIALCWSLQTLNTEVANTVVLPSEIWNMPQLRHIIGGCMRVSDPPPGDILVLHNLQTLVAVENLVMSEEVCSRIPNIRVLGVVYRSSGEQVEQSWSSHLHNLVWLSKLESLELSHFGEPYVGDPFEKLQLPNSLKELTLINCNIAWSGMGMIASLPHLEFLQLNGEAVVGPEWNFDEEIFHGLKRLIICHNHNLVNWTADCSNFPLLETLLLWNVPNLDEIPLEIGEIPTLENIIVVECSESVNKSARKIIEEQEDMGNLALRVVFSSGSDKLWWTHKSALERIEEEDHEEQIRTLTFTTGADCSAKAS
ncbi:putative late blight resistance protein homolog R1B-8 isoform X1 [Salvia hispanica]|uniref:putative late blight resistance protein homolog R1B-8 isoform X1 n=1 Tax=Salvia hispanica TaxID=49212 RepID=UPI002009BC8F|nr:putative late blight resistance protein homolog R1B-8 isoform X1 [Salvia hispanica]